MQKDQKRLARKKAIQDLDFLLHYGDSIECQAALSVLSALVKKTRRRLKVRGDNGFRDFKVVR